MEKTRITAKSTLIEAYIDFESKKTGLKIRVAVIAIL